MTDATEKENLVPGKLHGEAAKHFCISCFNQVFAEKSAPIMRRAASAPPVIPTVTPLRSLGEFEEEYVLRARRPDFLPRVATRESELGDFTWEESPESSESEAPTTPSPHSEDYDHSRSGAIWEDSDEEEAQEWLF